MTNTEAHIVVIDGKEVVRYTATDKEGHKCLCLERNCTTKGD